MEHFEFSDISLLTMVRVGDMLKRKSLGLRKKEDEALALFRHYATPTPGPGCFTTSPYWNLLPLTCLASRLADGTPGTGPLGANKKVFQSLMKSLVAMANDEAIKNSVGDASQSRPRFKEPSKRDIKAAFDLFDGESPDLKSQFID
jgi:hypothetical protein